MSIDLETLRKFCATAKAPRRSLHDPHTVGNFTYASDGYILVRVPAIDGYESPQGVSVPDYEHVITPETGEYNPLDLPPEPQWSLCNWCDGTGIVKDCASCAGTGEVECDLGHFHDCTECYATGRVEDETLCYKCEGHKVLKIPTPVNIGCAHFDWNLLAKISTLPGLELCQPQDPQAALRFRFDGGIGVIMPMRV